jgi:hypothetical protein
MSHTYTPDSTVDEVLVAAALERYQASWDEFLGSWFDRDRCLAVNAELDHLRKLMQALPRLSADLVEVVMRHAQLLLALGRGSVGVMPTHFLKARQNVGSELTAGKR